MALRFVLSSLAAILLPIGAAATDFQISDADALAIANAAFGVTSPDASKLPGFGVDRDSGTNPYYPRFIFYQATWAGNPDGTGSAVVGFVAVDRKTGDAWLAVMCQEIVASDLQKLQRSVRRRMGMSGNQYAALKRPGPECE